LLLGANSLATVFLVGLPTAVLAGGSAGVGLFGSWGVLQLVCWLRSCGVGKKVGQGRGSNGHDLLDKEAAETGTGQDDGVRSSRGSQSRTGLNAEARNSLISPGLHDKVLKALGSEIKSPLERRASQVFGLPSSGTDGVARPLFLGGNKGKSNTQDPTDKTQTDFSTQAKQTQ
jgi:hypothetical protein